MSSIKDVAALAGVGVGTVSRVINGSDHTSEKVKQRVNAAIEALNFHPNVSAQSLKSQKAKVVGLFVPVLNHPFFAAVSEKIEACLYKNGYQTMVVCSQDNKEKELSVLSMLARKRVDGAVFITHYNLGKVNEALPMVTIDRHFGKSIPCITCDNYDSTKRAIEHLIERGCRRIAYVGGKPGVESEVEERPKAYRETVEAHGLDEYLFYSEYAHGQDGAYAKRFFDSYGSVVDGILCSGDILSNAVYREARSRGIAIPQTLKIVSFDGIMRQWGDPLNLTAVVQDLDQMAESVVEALVKKIEGKPVEKKIVVPARLEIGETT